ncbi:HBS1-like protein, partial [Bulinus truncatus]
LIKQQQKVEKKSIPSTVQRVDDPVARSDHSVSLTELARQDKKGISPVRSVPQANSVPKAHVLDFTNLSDLIADYPKGSNSSTKDLSFGSLSPYATQSLVSLSNPTVKTKLDNSQTASPSLSELVKQHSVSQSEKNKTDLNIPTSPPFVKDFATLSLGGLVATLSLSSLTKDLSLDKSKSHDTDSVIRSSSASTVLPDSFSLASCLKTKNSSSLKSPHLKQVDQDKKERLFVQELRVNVHPGLMKGSIIQKVDTSLVSQASYFGLVLCGPYRKRKSDQFSSVKQRGVKHPKFLCTAQLCKVPMYKHTLHHFIKPFDFSTPSPDDIVKNKQKQAFTRSPTCYNCQPRSPSETEVISACTPLVTPSKSASKVTIGFLQAETQTRTLIPCQLEKLTLQVNRRNDASPAGNKKNSMKSELLNFSQSEMESKKSDVVTSEEGAISKTAMDCNLRNAVEFMGLEGDKDTIQSSVDAMKPIPATPKSKSKASKIDIMTEYAKRHGNKELLNLVVIGHVDAGKSTLMGHLLYQLGNVNKKTMHKYEQESKKIGKSSFAFAWVLDETDEERERGVTMDVAQTRFETEKKVITLLDAPGHKDFIPNMITGASQADVAILVINATRGEFETGFDAGGQTREHALLARSLGVGQIIVAVNKMDTVDWSYDRYENITKKIGQFLTKQAGFKESDISFIPCSGLMGENLTKPSTERKLTTWYKSGTTLIQQIENLRPPVRPIDKPLRLIVSDVFKGIGTGFNVAGRVGAGYVQPGDKILIMPLGSCATVKSVFIDDVSASLAFAGDHVNLTLSGVDMSSVNVGSCLCDPNCPAKSAIRIRAKIVIFNIDLPITKGYPVVFHYQAINEPALIKRLLSQLHRSTGEVIKKKPRCLVKNTSAVVEIELERPVCMELYSEFKDLGRFMLRSGGHTIAAGLVEELVQMKSSLNGANKNMLHKIKQFKIIFFSINFIE